MRTTGRYWTMIVLLVAIGLSLWSLRQPPASRGSADLSPNESATRGSGGLSSGAQAANSRSDLTPASVPAYPPPKLAAACEAQSKEMLKKLSAEFDSVIEPPFVVIGDMGRPSLKRMAAGSVVAPAEALWKGYFKAKPDKVITVLLFKDAAGYGKWATKLFGDTDLPHFGYYKPAERTLVMNIATGTGTLVHELTHALIVYDFPDVPRWFNEGFASLHEQCRIEEDSIRGLVNWRLPALQKALRDGKCRPLREMIAVDDFYGEQRGLNYAQARYFVMHLQEKKLLKPFYAYYREHHAGDKAAVAAVEHVCGKKIDEVEAELNKWIQTLRWPPSD